MAARVLLVSCFSLNTSRPTAVSFSPASNIQKPLTAMLATLQSGDRVTCLVARRGGRSIPDFPGERPLQSGIAGTNDGIGRRTARSPFRQPRHRLNGEIRR